MTEYSPGDLERFAREYADTEWMVHVTGPDDVRLHEGPDDEFDDTAQPLLTQQTALELARDTNRAYERLAARLGDEPAMRFHATVFRRGVPFHAPDATKWDEAASAVRAFLDALERQAQWTGAPEDLAGRIATAVPDEGTPGIDLLAIHLRVLIGGDPR